MYKQAKTLSVSQGNCKDFDWRSWDQGRGIFFCQNFGLGCRRKDKIG